MGADGWDSGRPPASMSMAARTALAGVMGTGLSLTVIDAVRQSSGSRKENDKNAAKGTI